MTRILLSGAGSIGRRHLRNLLSLGITDLIVHRRSREPVADAPQLPIFTDLQAALAAGPDAIIISNPTTKHVETALIAAQANCHLFIEKPLSHNWDGVDQLLQLTDRRQLKSMVGFDLRFDPGLLKVKALIDSGQIGRVVSYQAQVGQYLPDWHPWEDYREGVSARAVTGGGVLLDLIHELDYVAWLFGAVETVGCKAGNVSSLAIETEDVAALVLQHQARVIGTVHLDYIQRVPSRSCHIIGEEGTIVWNYFEGWVKWYLAEQKSWQLYDCSDFDRNQRFMAEMQHWLDYLTGRAEATVDIRAAGKSLALVLAAKESSAHNRFITLDKAGMQV